jgi:hypothetical protein
MTQKWLSVSGVMVREKAMPVKAGFKTVFKSKDLVCKILLVLWNAPGHTTVGLTHVCIQNEYLSNTAI